MQIDRLIKRKSFFYYLEIKDTKIKEMIDKELVIKPISIEGFSEKLFSLNELQEWIDVQKAKRDQNNQEKV